MKKLIVPIILLIVLSLCFGDILNGEDSIIGGFLNDRAEGNLAFSVRTATYNGAHAPRNAGAIWVTNSQNQFVKTIKKWASNYQYTLVRWIASSQQNTTGAITSASLNSHQLHNVSWNGKNYQGTEMPDGDYKINIEFTEHNASSGNMGKFKQITFTKGSAPVNLTIPNETYFRDMSLTWTPTIVNGTLSGVVTSSTGTPIFGAIILANSISAFSAADGSYSMTLAPGTYNISCIMDGFVTQEIMNYSVSAGSTNTLNFGLLPVSNDDPSTPEAGMGISPAFPNPFADNTTIRIESKLPGILNANVYDLKGRLVKSLSPTTQSSIAWDGKDDEGSLCVNGVYFIKVTNGNSHATRKVILQK